MSRFRLEDAAGGLALEAGELAELEAGVVGLGKPQGGNGYQQVGKKAAPAVRETLPQLSRGG